MFLKRLISSIVLLACVLFLGIYGGLPFMLFIGVLAIAGLIELYKVFDMHTSPLAIYCYIIAAAYYYVIYTSGLTLVPAVIFALIFGVLIIYVVTFPKYKAKEIMAAIFGIIYVAFTLSFVFLVRVLEGGKILMWLIFISAWGSDTLAYSTGMLFGKHKMTPNLSPKKSIEGLIGGIIGAGLLGLIYALVFRDALSSVFANPLLVVPIVTAVAGGLSVFGDLAASAIKREYEIKDYGDLIPGHGGILDRFDSIIISAPLVFFAIMFFTVVGL